MSHIKKGIQMHCDSDSVHAGHRNHKKWCWVFGGSVLGWLGGCRRNFDQDDKAAKGRRGRQNPAERLCFFFY